MVMNLGSCCTERFILFPCGFDVAPKCRLSASNIVEQVLLKSQDCTL